MEDETEDLGEAVMRLTRAELAGLERRLRPSLPTDAAVIGRLAGLTDGELSVACLKDFFAREAFEEWLPRRHGDALWRWFVRDWWVEADAAECLVQQTYLRLWRCVKRGNLGYEPHRPFRPYLRRTAMRVMLTAGRRQAPEYRDAATLDARAAAEDDGLGLLDMIGRLPDRQQAIVRDLIDGYTAEESASRNGVSVRQVYNARFAARRTLEEWLGGRDGDDGREIA